MPPTVKARSKPLQGVSGHHYSDRTGAKLPPKRGVPFVDSRGRTRILPKSGGKALDYVDGPAERFDPTRALRRAGVSAGQRTVARADRAAARAPRTAARALDSSSTQIGLGGFGSLLVYAFGTIIALALVENMLGGRGPAGVQLVLNALGGGIRKLVDPGDPIVSRGALPAATGDGAGAQAGTATLSARAGVYRNPLAALSNVTVGRTDQGLDLEAGAHNVGKPIGAIGNAQIVAVDRSYGGFGQYVAYKLLDGAQAGKVIFVGHSKVADVTVGDRVGAGDPVAYVQGYNAQPGHLELGYASPTDPYTTLARARGHVDPVTHLSPEGSAFTSWFLGLFSPKGGS